MISLNYLPYKISLRKKIIHNIEVKYWRFRIAKTYAFISISSWTNTIILFYACTSWKYLLPFLFCMDRVCVNYTSEDFLVLMYHINCIIPSPSQMISLPTGSCVCMVNYRKKKNISIVLTVPDLRLWFMKSGMTVAII